MENFVIASFMGMIAALSYASGLFSLYMGFLILLYYRLRQKHEKNLPIILWALLTILLTCSYFIGYKPIEAHPSAFAFLSNVKYHLHFFFSLVGYPVILSPYVTPHIITKAICCFGIIWFFSITFLVIKENKNNFEVLLPFFVLGIYSIISGLMITAGRAELGMDFSYRDRYTLITNFLWISNIVFTAFYFVKLHEKYRFFIKSLTIVFCFIMIATLGIKYIFGLYYMQEFSYKLSMATKGILEGKTTPETNEYLRGYMPLKLELLPILKKYNVSLYREQK